MTIAAVLTKILVNSIVRNFVTPFLPGSHLLAVSLAGGTMYGVDHPGDRNTAKYQKIIWNQASVNSFIFELDSAFASAAVVNAADGANQLRMILTLDGEPWLRVDGDTAPGPREWCVATGGGTGVGEVDIEIDNGAPAGASTISIRHAAMGTGTETIALGDVLTIGGNDYTVRTDNFVFDNDTPVLIDIEPPLLTTELADAAVTISAGSGRTVILGGTPFDYQEFELYVLDAADIETTVLAAGKQIETVCRTFLFSPDSINLARK